MPRTETILNLWSQCLDREGVETLHRICREATTPELREVWNALHFRRRFTRQAMITAILVRLNTYDRVTMQ